MQLHADNINEGIHNLHNSSMSLGGVQYLIIEYSSRARGVKDGRTRRSHHQHRGRSVPVAVVVLVVPATCRSSSKAQPESQVSTERNVSARVHEVCRAPRRKEKDGSCSLSAVRSHHVQVA